MGTTRTVCSVFWVWIDLRGYCLMCLHPTAFCCSGKPARWSQLTVPTFLLFFGTKFGGKKKLEFVIWTSLWFLLWHAGNRILTLGEVPKDQVYGVKLKGVSVCFTMLKAVLSGNYVNFGVFRLYGDDALDNALQTFIKLLLSIPHSDLLVRLKLDCEALCDGRRLLDVCLCVCRCRITPSSASPFTLCWRCWHRTTWTSSPAWSPKSWCTSCRRYPKGSPRSVITAHKSSRWEGRSVVALTCCVCLCVCCRYDGMHRLLFQSGPHSHLPV